MAWRHRTVAQEQTILALSKDHPIKAVARLVGVSAWTVQDVLRKYHWVSRFGRQHAAARRYSYDERAWGLVLEDLYVRQRLPQWEVAERCGVDVGTIGRRLRALGFGIRTGGETSRGQRRPAQTEAFRRKLPRCATEGCDTGVGTPGQDWCAACRRRAARAVR